MLGKGRPRSRLMQLFDTGRVIRFDISGVDFDMFSVSLTYTSEMTENTDLMDILEVSRANNGRDGITGVLLLCNNNIVQCLEGSREAVNATYARIIADRRHRQPMLLDYRVIPTRTFPNWSMGFVPESSLRRSILLKYSASASFKPRLLSGESCLAMQRPVQPAGARPPASIPDTAGMATAPVSGMVGNPADLAVTGQ